MPSTFPTTLDAFSTAHADNTGEVIHASTVNDLADAVNKIEPTIRRGPTFVVASSTARNKTLADYVCDGTADQVELQAAHDALPAAGGTILLTEGTYNLTSPLLITKSVLLAGAGTYATTLAVGNSMNNYAIRVNDAGTAQLFYGTIRDLGIDCNRTNNTSGAGIRLYWTISWTLQNLWIREPDTQAVEIGAPSGQTSYYNALIRCHLTLSSQYLLNVTGGELNRYIACTFDWCDSEAIRAGTLDRIEANLIGNAQVGILGGVKQCIINNHIERMVKWGIQLPGGANDCIIASNHLSNNSTSGSGQNSDILVEGQYHTITGNVFDSPLAKYNIEEFQTGGATGRNVIVGNQCKPSATGAINCPGSLNGGGPNIIRSNRGYADQATGTASIAAASSTITVTHGLATTPVRVFLTPTADTQGRRYWVSAKGTTTFTISLDANATTNPITFDWRAILNETL